MILGKQYHYCANCGAKLYDATLSMKHPSLCDNEYRCLREYEMKYARMILGKNADDVPTPTQSQ